MLSDLPILSLIIFSPLLGLLVLLFLPKNRSNWLKTTAIITTLIPLLLSFWLYADYDGVKGGKAYEETATWVNASLNKEVVGEVTSYAFQFQYHLGIDGLSLPLLLLTTIVGVMAALASVNIKKRWKSFYSCFLLLEVGMLGVFLARDVFLFFVFFELTLIPMFFLIGIWGYMNREKAANKFLIYNGIGSAIMLIAFVLLVSTAGFRVEQVPDKQQTNLSYSGSYQVIQDNLTSADSYVNMSPSSLQAGDENPFYLSKNMRWTIFLLLLIAFGIKLPIFPFHTWMLKVHAEAPPSVVMIHSGVLLKMGAYGLLRFGVFMFPSEAKDWAVVLAILGVVNILYGAVLALVQKEFKLVLAYSSISHMGIVLLGIASFNEIGLQGAMIQLVSHGLISALLFLIVGSLYERTGSTMLGDLGGLARSLPFISGILLTAGMASLGLPGLSGFIGEFLSLLGLFDSMRVITAIAVLGVILTAVYVLRSVLGITFGPMQERFGALRDARLIEAVPMIALLAFILLIGIYPAVMTEPMKHGFDTLLQQINEKVGR
ncbi:NADH-quinone oxidoreductase subunit M [Paenibacillus baekrokdamisoli]|uniref:NADH-quinone oxidoreductase subunit M n=1 Tax=Paenibacillus baekrokdamisoli TaxID=1712516 RepID=A0A3G9JLF9_9BACL|nr:NADH-quinone oxidoreductase subunit M [Paenibacillus baekrokdamisoli]MBB3069051.1 NADH-quinone oxidoreductase subunit M [Paenibacillus baekrokdamisoli]BBH23869.1 NADH-quinone oxidoreductase subunit M [Paenibacillus baekrokdamisoli]